MTYSNPLTGDKYEIRWANSEKGANSMEVTPIDKFIPLVYPMHGLFSGMWGCGVPHCQANRRLH